MFVCRSVRLAAEVFAVGETVLHAREPGWHLYLIASGTVAVTPSCPRASNTCACARALLCTGTGLTPASLFSLSSLGDRCTAVSVWVQGGDGRRRAAHRARPWGGRRRRRPRDGHRSVLVRHNMHPLLPVPSGRPHPHSIQDSRAARSRAPCRRFPAAGLACTVAPCPPSRPPAANETLERPPARARAGRFAATDAVHMHRTALRCAGAVIGPAALRPCPARADGRNATGACPRDYSTRAAPLVLSPAGRAHTLVQASGTRRSARSRAACSTA